MRKWLFLSMILIAGGLIAGDGIPGGRIPGAAPAATLYVSAAISLRQALGDIAKAYQAQTGDKVELVFGSSGQLAAQITAGADVDVFISAADKQVDDLVRARLADPATRLIVARNRLVLVVPAGAPDPPASFEALARLGLGRIAIGDPQTVPAGAYAMQVLTRLKVADQIRGRLVYGANVRQVLAYVEMGEVSAGIVYATDARQSAGKARVMATARPQDHEPIVYPAIAITTGGRSDQAARFLAFLHSPQAQAILAAHGFAPGSAPGTAPAPEPPR